jgi:LPXTG-motif cell wall-anchored protein
MSRTNLFLLTIIFLADSPNTSACINEYYRYDLPYNGKKLDIRYILNPSEMEGPYWLHGFTWKHNKMNDSYYDSSSNEYRFLRQKAVESGMKVKNPNKIVLQEYEFALSQGIDYRLLSDLAALELRIGNRENAVKLLEKLYNKYSNEYNVVANLGTAYEVTGKNELALQLLKRAVKINPASHFGSEWIHINILEQKLSTTPDYTKIMDLQLFDTTANSPLRKNYKKKITPDSLMIQLAYQLHERISFIAPPDKIVGQLVNDFADLVSITHSSEEAKEFYQFASTYDSSFHMNEFPEQIEKNKVVNKPQGRTSKDQKSNWFLYGGVAIVSLFLIFLIRKKSSPKS